MPNNIAFRMIRGKIIPIIKSHTMSIIPRTIKKAASAKRGVPATLNDLNKRKK